MKRLVFCFDGTSNIIEAVHPTNVVNIAASIANKDKNGAQQIVYYDEGVGSTKEDKIKGGAFGAGLHRNILEAYKFLILNYQPDDEIFIFGFSRGAFTARSFAGLIHYAGVMQRCHAEQVFQANWFYKNRNNTELVNLEQVLSFKQFYGVPICTTQEDDDWRSQNIKGYVSGQDPRLKIKYIGVWDTVKTLGWRKTAKEHAYHSHELNDSILSARHAVSLDEQRDKFNVTLWREVDLRNKKAGYAVNDSKRPFQQVWFPGIHGGVGGGGDIRGLSDEALAWVLDGATKAGLKLETSELSKVFGFQPDALAAIKNVSNPRKGFNYYLMRFMRRITREGPKALYEVSQSTIIRWSAPANMLPEKKSYSPKPLDGLKLELHEASKVYDAALFRMRKTYQTSSEQIPKTIQIEGNTYGLHIVTGKDTLSSLAKQYYGTWKKYKLIHDANATMITNPNYIYERQILLIPHLLTKEELKA